ncbi:hypothetical protein E2C01_037887 [Portunus trituberculatus]|uniref:Uncharacterized protein n=1 Tax=Portunus trituberculatus TaxID=210409 RepID=A0A5B7F9C2_PORTR|nr:hypothetical protein [Portunus trituberculatus]
MTDFLSWRLGAAAPAKAEAKKSIYSGDWGSVGVSTIYDSLRVTSVVERALICRDGFLGGGALIVDHVRLSGLHSDAAHQCCDGAAPISRTWVRH